MPKRGETRPWRVTFIWDGTSIRGCMTRASLAAAEDLAAQLRRNADAAARGGRGGKIQIRIQHRDHAKAHSVETYEGSEEASADV